MHVTTTTSKPPEPTRGALLREIEAYLRAVDVFRREGCAPRWEQEGGPRQ